MNSKHDVIRDFTAKQATYFDSNYGVPSPRNAIRRLRRGLILDLVGAAANEATVLDIGSGPAILFPELLACCRRYIALDLTPANLDAIRAKHGDSRLSCVVGDIDALPQDLPPSEVVICSGALEYATAPEAGLLRMFALLKEGGVLVCSLPNACSPYRLWSKVLYTPMSRTFNRLRGRSVVYYPRRLFVSRRIQCLLMPVATHVDIRFFGHRPLLQPLDALLPSVDRTIAGWLNRKSCQWAGRFASEFLVLARR